MLKLFCSLPPGGESLTGILRSKSFIIPAKLSFWMAGHDGFPDKPAQKKNLIQLRDAQSKKVLTLSYPPRNDLAQLFSWDLATLAGRKGFLEIIDGDNGTAFAWLAVGRLNPAVAPFPEMLGANIEQRQQEGAALAVSLRLEKLEPILASIFSNEQKGDATRAAAAKALAVLNPASYLADFGEMLNNPARTEKLRGQIAEALAEVDSDVARKILLNALSNAPRQLQAQLTLALASNPDGADDLLDAAEEGNISPRLLQENATRDRLNAAKDPAIKTRLEKLLAQLPPTSVEKQKLIDERRASFAKVKTSAEAGAKVFTQNCAVCHQLDKQGALVGPQLDGVGNRGADRLMEDILDPNRNVDRAFRTTLLVLKDGDVQSGLLRREEGETVVLADSTGKENSIAKNEIKERRESESSLMPDNFSDIIPLEDFNNLIAFLLSKGTKQH
ncbi:MAG: c-type cytochrome [Verrucomicrobiota bacterium]